MAPNSHPLNSKFCRLNGIKHLTTAPFHPASNGEAERFVRTFKTSMHKNISKITDEGKSVDQALTILLATYRSTPGVDGKSPAAKLHNREHRTLLSLLHPANDAIKYEKPSNQHKFQVNQDVYTKNFSRGEKY